MQNIDVAQLECWIAPCFNIFQAIERKHPNLNWPLLCRLLHDHFGRDQLHTLLRQLFRIQ
jgi:hypothetical protein